MWGGESYGEKREERAPSNDCQKKFFAAILGEFFEHDLFLPLTTGESVLGDNRREGEGTRRRGMGEWVVGEWEKVLGWVLHE